MVYLKFPGKKVQIHAYNVACNLCKKSSRWLALIDADEFIVPVEADNLPQILKDYENYPALGVNWILYGPSGHDVAPTGLVCENYKMTFADRNNELNCRIKSIVNPRLVRSVVSPHHCLYIGDTFAVDENKDEIIGEAIYAKYSSMACTMFNHTSKIRINHYWTKSKDELLKKCVRGYPDP